MQPEELDIIGVITSTDKASLIGENMNCSWDYFRHYGIAFQNWQNAPINVLEIGVLFGHSLRVWSEYFTEATIVGLDINPDCARFDQGRVEVRIGSQDDAEFLQGVAREFPPTIVIDDGSHFAAHMITSFETLFPMLAPGGLYVMEDLLYQFDYDAAGVRPYVPKPPQPESEPLWSYLSRLAMARLANVSNLEDEPRMSALYREVDEIRLVGSMAIIKKRAARNVVGSVSAFERQIAALKERGETATLAYALLRFAHYLATYDPKNERALELVDEGILLSESWLYGQRIKLVILRNLERNEAVQEMLDGFAIHGADPELAPIHKPTHMEYPHR